MSIAVTFDSLADLQAFASALNPGPDVTARLDMIVSMLTTIQQEEITVAADLSQLQTDVAGNTTVIGSAEALLAGLSAQLATAIAALPDPSMLQALQSQIESDDAGLAAAVAANTPAAPPPSGP